MAVKYEAFGEALHRAPLTVKKKNKLRRTLSRIMDELRLLTLRTSDFLAFTLARLKERSIRIVLLNAVEIVADLPVLQQYAGSQLQPKTSPIE